MASPLINSWLLSIGTVVSVSFATGLVGAETPEEMAVAILAEIIQVRYGHGTGVSLRGTDGRIHAQRGEEPGTA